MTLGPNAPTPAIAITGGAADATAHLATAFVEVPEAVLDRLRGACATVSVDPVVTAEAGRDWWPLAMTWALEGQVGQRAAAVVSPASVEEVSAVVAICRAESIPLTVAAGRSGVCGNSVPLHGGVVLDLCGLSGILDVDDHSLTVTVAAGTFGDHFEATLRSGHGLTVGHWPQSMALSTVGGWAACRGAGQYSTRYGKIEDIVVGLEVVLADGTVITTGGQPRQAVGPDLNQIFVGSEGTLGVITAVQVRAHPAPDHEARASYGFSSFGDGLDACRRILRRGATPAVLRLYDAIESERSFHSGDVTCALIVLDEGDELLVDATMAVVRQECADAEAQDVAWVAHWMDRRNDVSQLEALISGGLVVDTMEITGPWSRLDAIYEAATAAIGGVEGTLAVSAHQSHAYTDGACLYFTFAGRPTTEVTGPAAVAAKEAYYREVWDAGTRAVLANGGSLSHHHGVGLNRSRFVAEALGGAFEVLQLTKSALDPDGILNPGKLGLADPFGAPAF